MMRSSVWAIWAWRSVGRPGAGLTSSLAICCSITALNALVLHWRGNERLGCARAGGCPPPEAPGDRPGPLARVVSEQAGLPRRDGVRRAGHADGLRADPSERRAGVRTAPRP